MENLAPILLNYDIPTKEYVDSAIVAGGVGFKAYAGRWQPAWISSKAFSPLTTQGYWIYAYRIMAQSSINMISVENLAASGGSFCIAVYSDAYPWPGTQLVKSASISSTTAGWKSASLAITAKIFWLAIHNLSPTAVPMRALTTSNPYSPGCLTSTGVNFMDGGYAYNVGSSTTPTTWSTAGNVDATAIALFLRAG